MNSKSTGLDDTNKITRYKLSKNGIADKTIQTIQQFFSVVERKDIIEDTTIKEHKLRNRIADVGKMNLDEIEEIAAAMGSASDEDYLKLVLFLRYARKAQKAPKKRQKK